MSLFQLKRHQAVALMALDVYLGALRPRSLRNWTARMFTRTRFIGRFERYLDLLVFFTLHVVRTEISFASL